MVRAIDNGNSSSLHSRPEYTAELATDSLPLVRRIIKDLVQLNKNIMAQREQLSVVDQSESSIDQHSYQDEVRDVRLSLQHDEEKMSDCMDELALLGVQPHHPIDGSVDFPAKINRRDVMLCWHPDDATVCHWHEVGEDSEKRVRLDETEG